VEKNSRLTNEFKVKRETLIQENNKQPDEKQQEWIQKEEALRKENLALKKQRNEALKQRDEAIAASVDAIQNVQAKKLNESLQEIRQEIEKLKAQQQIKVVDSPSREFRELLVDITQELTDKEWNDMSNRFHIPKNKLPNSAFNFFWRLKETKEISSVDLSLLEKLLNRHERADLVEQFITPYRLRNANK